MRGCILGDADRRCEHAPGGSGSIPDCPHNNSYKGANTNNVFLDTNNKKGPSVAKRRKGEMELALVRRMKEHGRKRATIDAYCNWYYRYMLWLKSKYGKWTDPRNVAEADFEQWLTALACDRTVSPKTQNQAFSAICYLYTNLLKKPLVNASAAGASDTLRSLLANPARAMDRRKVDDEQEPPTLRIYAG